MRNLSINALSALHAESTGEALLFLLTISHDAIEVPIRVVNNTENITSQGREFIAYPFEIALPQESPDQMPSVQFRIDNVDKSIVTAIRAINSAATLSLELVLASNPDVIEAGQFNYSLLDVSYDVLSVTATLAYENILSEPFPSGGFIPSDFAGLF